MLPYSDFEESSIVWQILVWMLGAKNTKCILLPFKVDANLSRMCHNMMSDEWYVADYAEVGYLHQNLRSTNSNDAYVNALS